MLPLGTLTQAFGARFNSATASTGATVYDGDDLSTDAEGALQFRGPAALIYLPGASGVTLRRLATGTRAHLRTGTVVFSTSKAADIEILADEALIRPAADAPTIAQVTIIGPKELQIYARRSALQFSYCEESARIPEGAFYRILLDPPEAPRGPKSQGSLTPLTKDGKRFKIIIGTGVGLITAIALQEAFENPDRP